MYNILEVMEICYFLFLTHALILHPLSISFIRGMSVYILNQIKEIKK